MRDVIHCLRGTDFCPSHPFRGTIWGQNYEKNMKTGRKYGEKEKMQILIKSLIFRTLQIYIFSFYAFLFFVSLADAKLPENIPQYFIITNLSRNFSKIMHAFPDILAQKIPGDIHFQAVDYTEDGFVGFC